MTEAAAAATTTAADAAAAVGPAPKPVKPVEDLISQFDSLPLFMRELPAEGDAGPDGEGNIALEALQNLAYEGTPDEVAENFKSQGNEYHAGKRYREAAAFYTQALDVHDTQPSLREACFANRAACNLELKNYGMVLRDTSAALGINPKNVKAFFRAARALFALDKTLEAIDCCKHVLELEPENKPAQALKVKVEKRAAEVERREKETQERTRRATEGKLALQRALLARGLWLEVSSKPPDNPHPAHFDPESLAAESSPSIPLVGGTTRWVAPDAIRTPLILPVFLMYPAHGQSDLISHFHEDTNIGAHLDAMFPPASPPPPYDTKGEYTARNLVVYATTKAKRLLRVGRALTLREVLDQAAKDADSKTGAPRDGVVMQDGVLSLIVLPKGDTDKEWVERFKRDREASQKKQ